MVHTNWGRFDSPTNLIFGGVYTDFTGFTGMEMKYYCFKTYPLEVLGHLALDSNYTLGGPPQPSNSDYKG